VQTEGPPLTPERALEVTSEVLAALAHSHASGLVHRDIKPANVMLTGAGAVKVMDFGIARAADDTGSSLTGPAAVVGTAQYLSPEQARGEHVDARSDLYSTGCLLYELLLGRPPFTGESSVSLAYQHVNENPVPLREVDPSLSPEVEAVVMKALAKDPADRYASADEMRADIDRLLEQQRVHALPAAAPTVPVVARVGAGVEDDATALIDAPTGALARTVPTATRAGAPVPVVPVPVEPVPDPAPEEPPRRRRRTAVLVTVLVLALLAGVAALGLPRLFGPDPSTVGTVSVPNVLGQSRADADTALRNEGLVPRFTNVAGKDDDTLDHVVGQNPPSGRTLGAGSTVDVEVNVGPDSARIPSGLIGRDRDDAEKRLADAGFEKVSTTKAASQPDGAKEGEVLGVQPGEGELARQDQKVVLVVARARPRSEATSRQTTAPAPTEPTRSRDTPAPTDEPSSSSAPSDGPTEEPSSDPTSTASSKPSESSSKGSSKTPKAKAPKTAKKAKAKVDQATDAAVKATSPGQDTSGAT
jgi:serine/threonine-protein kinase